MKLDLSSLRKTILLLGVQNRMGLWIVGIPVLGNVLRQGELLGLICANLEDRGEEQLSRLKTDIWISAGPLPWN